MSDRLFYFCLITSAIFHLFLVHHLNSKKKVTPQKSTSQIEVTYQQIKTIDSKQSQVDFKKQSKILKEKKQAKPKNVKLLKKSSDKFPVFSKQVKDISKFTKKVSLDKKRMPQIKTLDFERKMSVEFVKSEKITNPGYISYKQTIWEMVRRQALSHENAEDFDEGQVYLTFIVNTDGKLGGVKIIEARTFASTALRNLAYGFVKDSAPFPPFPQDLGYPQLTFNVIISFSLNEFDPDS